MHPALSVIFFTVVSGCGFGLWLVTGALLVLEPRLLPRSEAWLLLGLGAVFATAGLLASTLHLGKPLRAWRAFSQWRSSWLSREGIAALAAFAPALALAATIGGDAPTVRLAAALLVVLALATVYCTAQIYASLRTIPAWHNGYVAPVYLLFALLGGLAWLVPVDAAFSAAHPDQHAQLAVCAALAGASIALLKRSYWQRIATQAPRATVESATGLGRFGSVRAVEAPHTETNYLTREFGFAVARRHAERLRAIAVVLVALTPVLAAAALWFGIARVDAAAAAVAALSVTAGTFVERWLFFAEARHVVMLYYGATAERTAR